MICHFLALHTCLKAVGPIYGSDPIGLLCFIGPWSFIKGGPVNSGEELS